MENKNADRNEEETTLFQGQIDVDEFLRVDKTFRVVCAAYALMLGELKASDGQPGQLQRRMISNMQADMWFKADQMMRLSPSLRRKAEAHLEALNSEVA